MAKFTYNVTFKTAADHALSEIFARNLQLDEYTTSTRSEEDFFLKNEDHSSKAQTAVQLSPHKTDNRGCCCCYHQKNIQLQEANNDEALGISAVDKTTIQHLIPIRPKARQRIIRASYLSPRHSAIHQQCHKLYHRRYPKSEKLLRCHYAPWAQATMISSGMGALLQHLSPPPSPLPPHPYPPRFTNTMTPFGLGKKRRRVDWSSMNDNMVSEAGGLDTILEEEVDKIGYYEQQESGRFKRQRRW